MATDIFGNRHIGYAQVGFTRFDLGPGLYRLTDENYDNQTITVAVLPFTHAVVSFGGLSDLVGCLDP